jgi:uncharacterized caspase-like protein
MAKETALIAASYEYQDAKLQKLRSPALDADQLARVLRDPEIGNFDVRVLPNQPGHVIRKEIGSFFGEGKKDDLLLLYFSCHGVKDDDGNLYFASVDTDVGNLEGTAVSADWVSRLITKSWSRRVLLLLDCCYSGAFASGMVSKGDTKVHIKERLKGDGRGRVVLTASDDMEYAWEGDTLSGAGQPSLFTRALVEGLQTGEADRDRDGFVSVDELYEYVYDRVVESTPNQKPNMWTFDLEGRLRIARSKFASDLALLPTALRVAIASPLEGVREGAVQELGHLLRDGDVSVVNGVRAALISLAHDSSTKVAKAAKATLDGFDGGGGMTIVIPTRPDGGQKSGGRTIEVTEPPGGEKPPEKEPRPKRPLLEQLKPQHAVMAAAIAVIVTGAALLWPDGDERPGGGSGGGGKGSGEVIAPGVLFTRNDVLTGMTFDGEEIGPVPGAPEDPVEDPAKSRDGTAIAYTKKGDLFVFDANGERRLTETEEGVEDHDPEWSSDNKRIAFTRVDKTGETTSADIWVVDVDSRVATLLTPTPAVQEFGPTWSPDDARIAFRELSAEGDAISVMNSSDGSDRFVLVEPVPGTEQRAPAWSPDPDRLVIVFRRAFDLHTIGVEDLEVDPVRFTKDAPAVQLGPVWSPDGEFIVFEGAATREGPADIYRVSSNGTGPDRLTRGPDDDRL